MFWFVITPIHNGIEGDSVSHLSMNYQSGTLDTIVIDGLEGGASYMFNATAVNMYGSSLTATSMSVLAGEAVSAPACSEKFSKLIIIIILT